MKRYIIDSNILMNAKNFEYGFDICPGFWNLLQKGFKCGRVTSHDKVRDEILAGRDELKEWVESLDCSYFPQATEEEIQKYLEMCAWAKTCDYKPEAIREFESTEKADALLCAKASVMGLTVVTLERANQQGKKRVKIPDVCEEFDIDYALTHEFVRELEAAFHLPEEHEIEPWDLVLFP